MFSNQNVHTTHYLFLRNAYSLFCKMNMFLLWLYYQKTKKPSTYKKIELKIKWYYCCCFDMSVNVLKSIRKTLIFFALNKWTWTGIKISSKWDIDSIQSYQLNKTSQISFFKQKYFWSSEKTSFYFSSDLKIQVFHQHQNGWQHCTRNLRQRAKKHLEWGKGQHATTQIDHHWRQEDFH